MHVRPSYLLYTSNYHTIQSQRPVFLVCYTHLTTIRSQSQRTVLHVCYIYTSNYHTVTVTTDRVCYISNYHTIQLLSLVFVFTSNYHTMQSQRSVLHVCYKRLTTIRCSHNDPSFMFVINI